MYFYHQLRLLLFLFVVAGSSVLTAQDSPSASQLRVEHFSASDGLVDDGAKSIAQDDRGMLWLGIYGGLVRYDGIEMRLIPETTPYHIKILTHGPAGALWFVASGRVRHFDPRREVLQTVWPDSSSTWRDQPISASSVVFDRDSLLWISTPQQGLLCLRLTDWGHPDRAPRVAQVMNFASPPAPDSLLDPSPAFRSGQLAKDGSARAWVATSRGVARPDPTTGTYTWYSPQPDTAFNIFNYLNALAYSPNGTFWAGGRTDQLYRFDPESERFTPVPLNLPDGLAPEDLQITFSWVDSGGRLWVNFRDRHYGWGMVQVHTATGRSELLEFYPNQPLKGYFRLQIGSALEDQDGNIWLGGHYSGLMKYSPAKSVFHWLPTQSREPDQWGDDPIGKVLVDGDSNIWLFGQDRLARWDPAAESVHYLGDRWPGINPGEYLFATCGLQHDERGNVWLWSRQGLFRYRTNEDRLDALHEQYPQVDSLAQDVINGLAVAADQSIWLTSDHGLFRFDPTLGRLETIFQWSLPEIEHWGTDLGRLYFDRRGYLWIGTNTWGFFRYDIARDSLIHFPFTTGRVFTEDSRGAVYVGTYRDGVVRVDPQDLSTRSITTQNGLPSNKIRGGLLVDGRDRLWVGTNNGLCRYDLRTDSAKVFQDGDGLPATLFTSVTADSTARGELVFGTLNGAVLFHPDSIQVNTRPPGLIFRHFQLLNDTTQTTRDSLQRLVVGAQRIELHHRQNNFSIGFAALHFKNPARNQYAVTLEPYETEWRHIGTQREVTYTNLDPGQYTFRVKAANSDGVWNAGIALAIEILPPWYWNGWSQAIYLVLFLGLLYAGYRFQLNRQLAVAEAERLRAMDETKNRIYTNITHEFRTPLTVIDGAAEQIREQEKLKETIHRNSRQLLLLVNRMLGLAKLDAGEAQLSLIHDDILHFLRYVTESFHSLALHQKINLNFHTELDRLEMDYDPEKVLQLLSNLISNALKFTPEYGKVTLVAREKESPDPITLELEVRDTGIGIAEADLPTIFERFHQLEAGATRRAEGTGIGLALVKELVDLMDGSITVTSQLDAGTTFTVRLPIRHTAQTADARQPLASSPLALTPAAAAIPESITTSVANGEAPQLLIVEDNRDVQQYLATCLRDEYELRFARNGREGIDSALEHIPDLIISDVMMPEVDGFELCRTLKQDKSTDHIPIILLTAKADQEAKLEGLEYGADAYLTKPFHRRELEIRLQQLFELRQRLRAKYDQPDFETESISVRQDEFVRQVRQQTLDHLDESDFDVAALSQAMHLHRSQLHRKLKALTGKSASELIRHIRLQEAHRMLCSGAESIKEVAYATGFSTPAHFSRVFSQAFGVPPSQIEAEDKPSAT